MSSRQSSLKRRILSSEYRSKNLMMFLEVSTRSYRIILWENLQDSQHFCGQSTLRTRRQGHVLYQQVASLLSLILFHYQISIPFTSNFALISSIGLLSLFLFFCFDLVFVRFLSLSYSFGYSSFAYSSFAYSISLTFCSSLARSFSFFAFFYSRFLS